MDKIKEFRDVIDPYFIGRPKHEVAKELPALISQVIEVDMSQEQEAKYQEALSGLLALGDDDDSPVKEVSKLTAISYCQEIANHPGLIDCAGDSGKMDALVELLTEGEFEDEKVIVFSRFRKMVDIIMNVLAANKIKAVRITGSEKEAERDIARDTFQDPKSDVRVICLTAAGAESLNLQAAKAVICFDTPWSAGDFLQLIGRMIRIGSVHDRCFVVHLVAKGQRKTVDHRVMEVLGKKMKLIEAVLGKRIKGESDQVTISAENEISDLFTALRQDAKELKL
jgi:SNF2 family DNA or RNA helicase